MIEIYPNVFVGDQHDFDGVKMPMGTEIDDWYVLHCAKEPYHRQFVGYTGRGCPKDSPEYLFARRGNRMALNMVDAKSPEFFSYEMVKAELDFLEEGYNAGKKLLIHCNRGESRSPSLAMLFVCKRAMPAIASGTDGQFTFKEAENLIRQYYPSYAPADGIRGHLMQYWDEY